ncbi:MAG: ABC transporter ATP-binding protein [Candidatus Marinimicrobia bacterium]|nr:ABC transporter ATP-binding protein [Candidatus Neomarinimicrobiota bacterium]
MSCHFQVRDLALSYRWKTFVKPIFKNLNLCVERGWFVTITGCNGSGKSSLIKLILGLVQPDTGELLLEGIPVRAGFPGAVRNHQIAYMAQQIEEMFFANTVREELSYGADGVLEKQGQVLAELGMNHFMDRTIESLSGGERQGLALAQFMIQEAPFLLLDEPSSYLDQSRADRLKDFMMQAHRSGKTILHVTQYTQEISWGTHHIDLDQTDPKVRSI